MNNLASKVNIKTVPQLFPMEIDFNSYFQNDAPLDVELGCGRPHFLFDRVKNFPNRNIVGIEWKHEFVLQAKKKIERENINNAIALHGNAWILFPALFKKNSVDKIFVNFPDPWWKEKHKKRLLLNELFLPIVKNRLKKDGTLIIQTDVKELFDFYKALVIKNGFKLLGEGDPVGLTCNAKTHREKKCLENNLNIFRVAFLIEK